MKKHFLRFAAAALALCLAVPAAGAVNTNANGDVIIRVGLASSSKHVETGELEAAHLENNTGYGSGYRFGYYDSGRNFVELARTDASVTQAAVLKTQNLYYGRDSAQNKDTYSSAITSGILVGCYHLQIDGTYSGYEQAQAAASQYSGGFVAWINGSYQVRVGAYASKEDAEAAMAGLPQGAQVVGTSSSGMNVVATGTSRILFQYDDSTNPALGIQPDVTGAGETRTWFAGYKYRGGFQYLRRNGGNLTVVNMVELEDYVNGVICYEMGREWPLEALKAQALCARTYVLKNLGKHNSDGFDICPTAYCQVYHGMGSKKANYGPSDTSVQAVRETAGQVITYNGKLAETFYSSSFGGASEDAKNVWGTDTAGEYPYLRGVVDPYEQTVDSLNPSSPWTVSYTADELTKKLQGQGLGTGSSVASLELTYSPTGNVILAVVHWANGQSNTLTPSNIRSRFGVSSIRFTVNGQSPGSGPAAPAAPSGGGVTVNGEPDETGLEGMYTISDSGTVSAVEGDAPYVITGDGTISQLETSGGSGGNAGSSGGSALPTGQGTVLVSGGSYIFQGGGLGHQVGLSQFGANAMARQGFSGSEIVTFYLPGVQIGHY